jgi:gliding motility-associated lipoprotein GldH
MKIRSVYIFLVILCLSSCSRGKVFEEYRKFPDQSWNRFRFLTFDVMIDDPEPAYDVFVTVRHLPEFPYNTLDVNLNITYPSGEERNSNHHIHIRDASGKLLGEGLGDLWDVTVPVKKGVRFPAAGKYRFDFENKMTKVQTPALLEFGLTVKKASEKTGKSQ